MNSSDSNGIFKSPIWLAGFRPFFTLALISGAIFPILWAFVFSGHLLLPESGLNAIQWHAHEMLFGFGWAVLGGFLLTASKNWVKIRGLHGAPLAIAAGLWIIERVTVFFGTFNDFPLNMRVALQSPFLIYVVGYVVWSLLRFRKNDTFKDNYFFIIALPLFIFAKYLILSPDTFQQGYHLAVGLFRVAFVVMFERTISQFMKNTFAVEVLKNKFLDTGIKILVLLAAFESFLPQPVATIFLSLSGLLLFIRFCFWHPIISFRKFEIGIMYVGYFGLIIHFIFQAMNTAGILPSVGTLSLHTFTFLCMGLIIPSMLIRISQGHTGRKLIFTKSDKLALYLMGAAGACRLIGTQVWPEFYLTWISLAATGWSLCFAILGFRLIPFLWKPRIDGREH